MSILTDFASFWANNTTLNASVPTDKLWFGIVADGTALPYVVITLVISPFTPTVGTWYYELHQLQLSIFHDSLATALSLADTITGQLDRATIGTGYMMAIRQSKQVFALYQGAYQVVIEYEIGDNGVTVS